MPDWRGSDRRSRLPANWPQLRARVLRRDKHRCTWIENNERCPNKATDVDHRRAGDDHSESNLRSLCADHHKRKSGQEGAAAIAAKRKKNAQKFRRDEPHPGFFV